MRGCDGEPVGAGARPVRRRARVRRVDSAVPARVAAVLLPDARHYPGRRGPAPGDARGGLARTRPVRGAVRVAYLAIPNRDEPLPERAACPRSRPDMYTPEVPLPETDSRGRPALAGTVSGHAPV